MGGTDDSQAFKDFEAAGWSGNAAGYGALTGKITAHVAGPLLDAAGVGAGTTVLDVGCGHGDLCAAAAARGAQPTGVDLAEGMVDAARAAHPDLTFRVADAEALPFDDGAFDAVLSQLVVNFLDDPPAGVAEMRRVARPGGVVAACVWDYGGGTSPLSTFWDAARQLDPEVDDESGLAGARAGHLAELFAAAGLREIEEASLEVRTEHPSFEDWWEPYTFGVGPAGAYVRGLDPERRAELRELCRERLPEAPFVVTASAWAARGIA